MKRFFRAAFFVGTIAFFSASQCWAVATSSSRLEIVGDKLYIAGIGHGFHVLDISNPAKPKWIGGWNNHTCPVGVQVVDGLAYLANRTSGFEVVDVDNPAAPAQIGHLSTGGDLQTVQVTGHYAYVADEKRGFDVIDVSDPKQPKLVGDFETKGQGWNVVADGDYAYASYGGGVLRTFQLQNGTNPKLIKESPDFGSETLQMVNGKLLSQHFGALCLMDMQNPANPVIVADSQVRLPFFSSAYVRDSLAFVTGGNMGLGICELNAGKIQLLSSVETGYQGFGIRVHGNFAYVVDGGSNLHVFDVSNPARPVEVNRVGTENFCSQVLSLAGDTAEKSSVAIPDTLAAITNAPPQLTAAARLTDGSFSFSLHGVPGGIYDIQASTDLVHWTVISSSTLPETGVLTISDPDAHLFNNRFYRAIKQQ
jgi:hypothetical protein